MDGAKFSQAQKKFNALRVPTMWIVCPQRMVRSRRFAVKGPAARRRLR
jgi:hypothetical protein